MSDDNMYTFRVPGIIDTSIRDLTKEAARIQDEVIQEALTARGWISPDDRKAHDAEVILEYVKRAKPEPIHIDNIDGVKASDWFRARYWRDPPDRAGGGG